MLFSVRELAHGVAEFTLVAPLETPLARQQQFDVRGGHSVVEAVAFRLLVRVSALQNPHFLPIQWGEEKSEFPHVPTVEVFEDADDVGRAPAEDVEHANPQKESAAGNGGVGRRSSEFDTWRALQRATNKKRADIIADIVGHPTGAPSVEELDYMNPPLSDDSIRRHLSTLADVGVVRVLEFEPGNRIRGYPYQFFELTPDARDLFDRNGLFPEDAWRRQYAAVEKTSRVKELESMPRPDA